MWYGVSLTGVSKKKKEVTLTGVRLHRRLVVAFLLGWILFFFFSSLSYIKRFFFPFSV
jgi:predicted acyltransferase